MRERIQKLLAGRGAGSRRQVEAWIAEGRLSVNGRPAAAGQPVDARDDIRLDGRRLRLGGMEESPHRAIAYHRPAQEGVRARDADAGSMERLPKAGRHRWIPVNPLPPRDGGLEIFVTDGTLAAALTRRAASIPGEFGIRIRGALDESAIEAQLRKRAQAQGLRGTVDSVRLAGGEGSNRWLQVAATGLRARELRGLLEAEGLEANRILRTRIGPIGMDRALARGRHRALTGVEMDLLRQLAQPPGPGRKKPGR